MMPHNHSWSDDVKKTLVEDVYVVTRGAYSDKTNIAVFATKEEAKAYADEMNTRGEYETYEWERVDFNPPLPTLVERLIESKIIHIAKVVEDTIADGRKFYRVHCSCNFVSGPLWSAVSAERYAVTHMEGSVW